MNRDVEQLKLLSILHYVLGGLTAFFSCFPIFYVALGIFFALSPHVAVGQGEPPPPAVGFFLIALGIFGAVLAWAWAICLILAGRFLARQQHYVFCLVIAAISCLSVPLGTALGIFTIIVLAHPSVKELFERQSSTSIAAAPETAIRGRPTV